MKNIASQDEYYNLWALLRQTREAMFMARKKDLGKYNISPRRAAVLFIIQAIGDKATPAEISRWLFREPHSVSHILSRMEKEGLVRKAKDLDRKNMIRVSLTDKGLEVYEQVMKRESIHNVVSALSEEERERLKSYLKILRGKALKEAGIEPDLPFPPA